MDKKDQFKETENLEKESPEKPLDRFFRVATKIAIIFEIGNSFIDFVNKILDLF